MENIISLCIGSLITLLVTYYNNKNQIKQLRIRHTQEKELNNEEFSRNRVLELDKQKLESIQEIILLLKHFEYSISLTSSTIDVENSVNIHDHDDTYRNELVMLHKLQSLIFTFHNDLYQLTNDLGGVHNCYWGRQRSLLRLDVNDEHYKYALNDIINTSNQCYQIIREIQYNLAYKL